MEIEVRHARVIVALAETRSISKASSRLALPQPSLSAQLRRIERAVGGPLFVRSRLGVEPTALGERLIPMMAELAAHADAIVAQVEAHPLGSVLRVGNVEWTPVGLQKTIVAALPGREVRTETLDSRDAALAAIGRGQLDAALVSGPVHGVRDIEKDPELATHTLVSEPVWVALPRDVRRPRLDLTRLRALRWVRRVRDHSFQAAEERFFRNLLGFQPDAVHRVASHAEAMSWVRDAGVAALATATAATRDVELVHLPVEVPRDELTLVWRRGALEQQPFSRLIRALRTYYLEYVHAFPGYRSWLVTNPGAVPELTALLSEA